MLLKPTTPLLSASVVHAINFSSQQKYNSLNNSAGFTCGGADFFNSSIEENVSGYFSSRKTKRFDIELLVIGMVPSLYTFKIITEKRRHFSSL
jgi:hypothetical protein